MRATRPMTIARPGSVWSSSCRTPGWRSRDGGEADSRDRGMYVDFAILADVSLVDREAHGARSLQYSLSARGPGTGSFDRRDRHSDLSDIHLRAGRARPAQGVRVRADAE